MEGQACHFPGRAVRYGYGPSLEVFERGPCGHCDQPVLSDDSFCRTRTGTYLHTNNAVDSCNRKYDRELRAYMDRSPKA